MKNLLLACVIALAATSATGCIISSGGDSTIEVFNDSSFFLEDIAFAEFNDVDFGPNVVPGGLAPGDSVIVELDCGDYDIFIEDELGAQCTILGIDVCFDDAGLFIDDPFLSTCSF